MAVIRVVVVDDDDDLREALTEVLAADGRFEVVGTGASADEAVAVTTATRPHVVLLDVRMPGGGVEAARAICQPDWTGGLGPADGVPVVVAVSAQTGVAAVVSMLRAGAVGYLAKGRLRDLPDLVAATLDELVTDGYHP